MVELPEGRDVADALAEADDPGDLLANMLVNAESAEVDTPEAEDDPRGTRMAAHGVPMRTLQEWMGHASINTTMIFADYSPSEHENAMAERAFGTKSGTNLSRTDSNSDQLTVPESAEGERSEPAT